MLDRTKKIVGDEAQSIIDLYRQEVSQSHALRTGDRHRNRCYIDQFRFDWRSGVQPWASTDNLYVFAWETR